MPARDNHFTSAYIFSRIGGKNYFMVEEGMVRHTIDLAQLGMNDLEQVGGKNASLGEMISHLAKAGVAVPGGFATKADSFRAFLSANGLDKQIYDILIHLDTDDVKALTAAGQ